MGRQGHLRPDQGRPGFRGCRSENSDDRRHLFESAPHGVHPAVEKLEPDGKRGRLAGQIKDGMNTKLYTVNDADDRLVLLFMSADQISDYTGAPALLNNLSKPDWLLTGRSYDAECLKQQFTIRGLSPSTPGRKSLSKSIKQDKCCYKCRNRIEFVSGA